MGNTLTFNPKMVTKLIRELVLKERMLRYLFKVLNKA